MLGSSKRQLVRGAVVASALAACGEDSPGGGGIEVWLGEQTHLAVSGTFQDKTFDVRLQGDDAGIYCTRLYAPLPGNEPDSSGNYDSSQLYFATKAVRAVIQLDDQPTEFMVSYWRHDEPAGTTLEVIPRSFGTPIPAGKTWSNINLFAPGADVLSGIESAAESGTVRLELNSGEPDANGVMIPDGGRTGVFVSLNWGPGQSLTVSATATCGRAVMAPWAPSIVLP